MPWDPDELEVSSTHFGSPTDAGIIDAQKGIKILGSSGIHVDAKAEFFKLLGMRLSPPR
jgi:hypothetical protein